MAKSVKSKLAKAKKLTRAGIAKKRIRRVIFKSDEWYAGAASSIGIAGRLKGSRPVQFFVTRAQEKAEAD